VANLKYIVLGAGGHARVVVDCIRARSDAEAYAMLDPEQKLWGQKCCGIPVMGGDDLMHGLRKQGVTHFAVGVGSVGDSSVRRRLFDLATAASLDPIAVVHPSAVCSPSATIGQGAQLFPRCVVNAGASLGANVIVNTGAIVEHDCVLDDHVHVAPGATLGGGCQVWKGAHVGLGATVLQGVSIGAYSIVGAGAVVLQDVPPRTMVAGVPARVIRALP